MKLLRKNQWWMIYGAAYLAAALGSQFSAVFSCLMLVGLALGCYAWFFNQSKSLVNLPGLLGAFWFGGEALACLKLSNLSSPWEWMTWVSFFAFYTCFLLAYQWRIGRKEKFVSKKENEKQQDPGAYLNRIFQSIVVLTMLSFGAFVLEACILGFVPALTKDTPHAYSYFHVTGIHYFTVSSVLVHPLSLLYFLFSEKKDPKRKWLILLNLIAISIPFLCVSRFFMIMAVAMTLLIFLGIKGNISGRTLIKLGLGCLLFLIPVYLILTVFRSHSVSYLNEIFDMKNKNMPIFITQPYMYVANNYENFNCLVRDVGDGFLFGRRQLFPVLALTGLKFMVPDWLVSTSPVFITKEELTTVTILYDAYFDFGILGVMGFGAILGVACAFLTGKVRTQKNPVVWLFYGQIAMYLVLSFFTTWFSNPTTWFWLALTGMIYWYTQRGVKG